LRGDPMNTQDFKRKLTAVFSADVAGYSRLMGEDEMATVKTLETYKQVMSVLIKQHRGRVIDSPGDNLLAEFASVVDAVQCGVAVQKELLTRNADLPDNRRMQFRIGINLGDVIEEGERIYGDGVNIAARLEALAHPGGICVSKTAFDHIESKLPLGYEYLGEQTVKNIARPVGAYRVVLEPRITVMRTEGKEAPSAKRRVFPAMAIIVILVVGALALWQFFLKQSPPPQEKADFKKSESQLLAQLEAQKQATEQAQRAAADAKREAVLLAQKHEADEALRREQEERSRLQEDRKRLDAERRASDKAKKQAADEVARLEQDRKKIEREKRALEEAKQEERNRLEEDRKQLEIKKQAAEVTNHDGPYSGLLCNRLSNKPPVYWPVALVVRNGIAEGSWISRAGRGKTARAHGTVAADGSVRLKLEAWTPSGDPVQANLIGRVVDGTITVSGRWDSGPPVSGEWKCTQVAAAATASKASPVFTGSHDGTYTGQLCNQWTEPPFCWPVTLVVRNGIAEGGWIGLKGRRAKARGTVATDGLVRLNLEAWTQSGDPVKATLFGRIVDGAATASGTWSTGGSVTGDWKRTP
jgi:class 3 adenylate cyclase